MSTNGSSGFAQAKLAQSQGRHPDMQQSVGKEIINISTSTLSPETNLHQPSREEAARWYHYHTVKGCLGPGVDSTCPDTFAASHTPLATKEADTVTT